MGLGAFPYSPFGGLHRVMSLREPASWNLWRVWYELPCILRKNETSRWVLELSACIKKNHWCNAVSWARRPSKLGLGTSPLVLMQTKPLTVNKAGHAFVLVGQSRCDKRQPLSIASKLMLLRSRSAFSTCSIHSGNASAAISSWTLLNKLKVICWAQRLVQQGFNLQHFGLTSWKSVARKGCLSAHPIDQNLADWFLSKLRGLVAMENYAKEKVHTYFWLLPPKSCTSKRISWLALGNNFKVLTGSDKKRVRTRTRGLNVTSPIVSSTRLRALRNLQLIHGISTSQQKTLRFIWLGWKFQSKKLEKAEEVGSCKDFIIRMVGMCINAILSGQMDLKRN